MLLAVQGNPHFRYFSLSRDLTFLSWGAASNRAAEKTIRISEITEIKFGQVSAVFKKNRIPEYEVYTHVIVYVTIIHITGDFIFSNVFRSIIGYCVY